MNWRKLVIFDLLALLAAMLVALLIWFYSPFFHSEDLFLSSLDDSSNYGSGFTVDKNNNILILDNEKNKQFLLLKFDTNGSFKGRFSIPIGDTIGHLSSAATNLAVDSQNNIYVADYGNARTEKYNNNGQFVSSWNVKAFQVIIDNQDNLFVNDGNYIVRKYDPNGNLLLSWGSQGKSNGQFGRIVGMTLDRQNNIYVADSNYSDPYGR